LSAAACRPAHAHAQELLAAPVSDETLAQIEKDLPRTLSSTGVMQPGETALSAAPRPGLTARAGSPVWEGVKRMLRAYAAHDVATGYVQARGRRRRQRCPRQKALTSRRA